MRQLSREVDHWERLASNDPMWVILTRPDKQGGGWTEEEFFQTGRDEIAEIFRRLDEHGLLPRRGVALDFGCGIGRLTQALAERFDHVDGVDISARMIAMARERNRFGARVNYHVNTTDALAMIPSASVDFVYSYIALQHIPRREAEQYVREFGRVLAVGGIAVFQVLTRAKHWTVRARHQVRDLAPDAYRWLRDLLSRRARWELNVLGEESVREALASNGAEIRYSFEDGDAAAPFESRRFIAVRSSGQAVGPSG